MTDAKRDGLLLEIMRKYHRPMTLYDMVDATGWAVASGYDEGGPTVELCLALKRLEDTGVIVKRGDEYALLEERDD